MIYKTKLQISRTYRRITLKKRATKPGNSYVHWWSKNNRFHWLDNFCAHYAIQPLVFGSVFGPRDDLNKRLCDKKHVFFTSENIGDRFSEYDDHMLSHWDQAIGFQFRSERNYMRFPLWLIYYVNPLSKNPGRDFVQ